MSTPEDVQKLKEQFPDQVVHVENILTIRHSFKGQPLVEWVILKHPTEGIQIGRRAWNRKWSVLESEDGSPPKVTNDGQWYQQESWPDLHLNPEARDLMIKALSGQPINKTEIEV